MPAGRILVVDDDRMVRDTLGRVLEQEGYDVEYGRDGNEALDRMREQPPDVILLDLMMPGMNGRQFLTALRDQGQTEIPVVVMTAVHGLNTHQALSLGACDVIEKPFDMDSMLNKVALAIFRARRDDPSVPATSGWIARADTEPELIDQGSGDGVVVVVDDDRAESARLDSILSGHGFTVVCVGHASDELGRLARVLEPRAIVLALDEPHAGGLAELRMLRADRDLDHVPVLVVSSNPGALAAMSEELGALRAAALLKPVRREALLSFVTQPPDHARRAAAPDTDSA